MSKSVRDGINICMFDMYNGSWVFIAFVQRCVLPYMLDLLPFDTIISLHMLPFQLPSCLGLISFNLVLNLNTVAGLPPFE